MSATDPRVETLTLLRSIDASLKALVARSAGAAPSANDRVCDGPIGDPIVKWKDPRDWTGDSMKGQKFSECPPDYLDMLAERFDYFIQRNTEALNATAGDGDPAEIAKLEKDIKYGKLDAQRARGWAARLRNGYVAPERNDSMKASEPQW